MSIIICKHCEQHIDTDFDAGHEEECIESNTGCETCAGTGKVDEGQFDDIREVDCPDCIDFEGDDMSGATEGDR